MAPSVFDNFEDRLSPKAITARPRSDEEIEREALQDDSRHALEDWPKLPEEALYGLAGDVVRTIDPHTEADRAAILAHFLAFFGNCAGPTAHFAIGGDIHPMKLFVALVGDSNFGRKGTSEGQVRRIFESVDLNWAKKRIVHGLASGEGLIRALMPDGVSADSRLCVIESEMVNVLKAMGREGSILSGIIRQAWDSCDMAILRSKDPVKVYGVHVSMVTHVTRLELLSTMDAGQNSNGFANRFLWVLVRRSKFLPDPEPVPSHLLDDLARRTAAAIDTAARTHQVKRDPAAKELWRQLYPSLSSERPGLAGLVTSRAQVQVLRLSLVYALLDSSPEIRLSHLKAALAFWGFSVECVTRIFGRRLGNPIANRLWRELGDAEGGELSAAEVWNALGRNVSAQALEVAAVILEDNRILKRFKKPRAPGQKGRTTEVYKLTDKVIPGD